MSRTYAYALIGAVIATFTVTPVLSSILLPADIKEVETLIVRNLRRVYMSILPLAVRHAGRSAIVAAAFQVEMLGDIERNVDRLQILAAHVEEVQRSVRSVQRVDGAKPDVG